MIVRVYFGKYLPLLLTRDMTGRDEGKGRVRAHADRGREIPVLPAAGLLLPGAGGGFLPPHLARAGPGVFRSRSVAVPQPFRGHSVAMA